METVVRRLLAAMVTGTALGRTAEIQVGAHSVLNILFKPLFRIDEDHRHQLALAVVDTERDLAGEGIVFTEQATFVNSRMGIRRGGTMGHQDHVRLGWDVDDTERVKHTQ